MQPLRRLIHAHNHPQPSPEARSRGHQRSKRQISEDEIFEEDKTEDKNEIDMPIIEIEARDSRIIKGTGKEIELSRPKK